MSKKNGSITPTTVLEVDRSYFNFDLLMQKLREYEGGLQDTYTEVQYNPYMSSADAGIEFPKYENYNKKLKDLEKFALTSVAKAKNKTKFETVTENCQKYIEHFNKIITNTIPPLIEPDCCFLKIYQQEVNGIIPTSNKPFVRHYGIDPEHTKGLVGHIIANNTLHPIEKQLLIKAANILSTHCSSETFLNIPVDIRPFAHNMVLVDIFSRKDVDGTVFISLDTKVDGPETHTVVLWKTKEHELTLIDPTNEKFSHFLVGQTINGYRIISGQDPESQLYSNDHRNPKKESRDCTDIAVKIAFELNECQRDGANVEVVKRQVIDTISNQNIMTTPWKNLALDTWDFHSSDYNTRHEYKTVVDKFLQFPTTISDVIDFKKIKSTQDIKDITTLLGGEEGLLTMDEFLA